MFRKLRLITPELFTAGLLLGCWLFADARLQLISLACIGLLLFRRLEELRQSARHNALIRELTASQEQLVRVAQLDRLTGLLNRFALLSKLQAWLTSEDSGSRRFAILFLDFDRFKVVNDSLGHQVGDQLLVHIGRRLRTFVGMQEGDDMASPGNLAARLGGDEFVLVIQDLEDEEVRRLAECLMTVLEEPYLIGDTKINSTASIGIVINKGRYTDASALVRDADVAMYESKRGGRARYLVFDTTMRDRVQRRQRLEIGMAQALECSELQLVYQPIVCVHSGQLKSVEALMRWRHPQEGWVSPVEFIPIAEESGLIQKLCDWAVFEGCCQLLKWKIDIDISPSYSFSLNLSPRQFSDATLAHRIQQTIEEAGVDPATIVFELTESVLMSEPETALKILQTIKSYGSRIALDDFGTGHSSLSSLHRFPVDILKFDRSFTKDIHKDRNLAAMVYSIAVLARNLGISTVAEGIETPEQFVAVRELGCDLAQGYLIAKPLSAVDFAQFASSPIQNLPCGPSNPIGPEGWEHSVKQLTRSVQ